MNRTVLLLPLLAAACNSGPSVTAQNASIGEVQKKVEAARASGQLISPGQWETKVSITKMDMPAMANMPGMDKMPPEVLARIKEKQAALGQPHISSSCVTPEDAKGPKANMFGADKNCRYDHFNMANGQLDAVLTCTTPAGPRTSTLKGTFSDTEFHVVSESKGAAGPIGAMSVTIDAHRTGECTDKGG